jgi:hypothetical protein
MERRPDGLFGITPVMETSGKGLAVGFLARGSLLGTTDTILRSRSIDETDIARAAESTRRLEGSFAPVLPL